MKQLMNLMDNKAIANLELPVGMVVTNKVHVPEDDRAPIPTHCPYCNSNVCLVNNSEIYNGKSYGDWPYAYICFKCDAYVGLHKTTLIPLGSMANAELRELRKLSKGMFFDWMYEKKMNRTMGYSTLAKMMNIPKHKCHFGMFSNEDCEKVMSLLLEQ